MTFNATNVTASFVANMKYNSAVTDCTTLYHNQEYYYKNNFTLKVFDASTNTMLSPNDDITKGDYKNVITLNNTQSCLTFNSKYTTGQKFRIELLANTGGDIKPKKNTTTIILCCVVAIILIIGLAVWCIKRNSAKALVGTDRGEKNRLVQDGSREQSIDTQYK